MPRAAAGNPPLLDQMFNGINLVGGTGTGAVGTTVNGVPQTGAGQLRAATASPLRNNLANGNYVALANSLNTLNYNPRSRQYQPAGHSGRRPGRRAALQRIRREFHRGQSAVQHRNLADESREHELPLASIAVDVTADCRRQSSGDLHVEQTPGECRRVYPSI